MPVWLLCSLNVEELTLTLLMEAQGMIISSFNAEAIIEQDAQQLLGLVTTMRNLNSTPTISPTISAADKNDALFRACTSGDTEESCPSNNLSVKEGRQAKSQAVAKGDTLTELKLAEEEGIIAEEVEALEAEAEVEETRIELGQAEERGDKEAVTKCHERLRDKEAMARQRRQEANAKNQNTSAVSGTVSGADECCCCTYKISFSKGACCSCLQDVWTLEVCSAGAAYGFFCCPCATTTLMCCNAMSCNHIAMNGNEEHPDTQNQCDPRNEIHCIPCVMGAAFLGRLLGVKYFYGGNQRHDEIKSLIPAVYAYYGESMCGLEKGQVMHTQDNRDGYVPKPELQAGINTEAQSSADEVYASHLEATAAAVDVDTSVNLEAEVEVETNVKTEVTAESSTNVDVEDHGSV